MKAFINRAEFYITNVCNYNCDHCNRFNNYRFTGHEYWKDSKDIYTQWSKKIDIGAISILGGEPTLNPSINEWIDGIASLWPGQKIEIVTNGTRLNKVKGLYNTLKKHNGRVSIYIGLHNRLHLLDVEEEIFKFLDEPVLNNVVLPDDILSNWKDEYNKIKADEWPECETPNDFENLPKKYQDICKQNNFTVDDFFAFNSYKCIVDKNNISIEIHIEDVFHKSALELTNNEFTVNNSNPEKAHNICFEKNNHHFVKGKLYKCNVSAVLPMFYKQFNINMSAEDINIMDSYVPLTVNNTEQEIAKFIKNLPSSISQCKFCPEWLDAFKLNPSTIKPNITKKHR